MEGTKKDWYMVYKQVNVKKDVRGVTRIALSVAKRLGIICDWMQIHEGDFYDIGKISHNRTTKIIKF